MKMLPTKTPIVAASVTKRWRKDAVPPTLLRVVTIDGLPGYVSLDGGGMLQTTALDIREDGIAAIYIVKNPDKLSHLAAEVDFPKRILPIPPA
jgi:RNA polymerase sigma-70 factor (ECF subfamily)